VDATLFDDVSERLTDFHRRFASLFGRPEARHRGEQYLRGLVVQQTDRRNAENLADAIPGATPRALQRFLTEAPWDAAAVVAELQTYLAERPTAPDAVFVLDETGFPKQGTQSVGVARQDCGTLGKIGNCQVGVFLASTSLLGTALVDHRLYLPERWIADRARCAATGVPADVGFQTTAALGRAMLRQMRQRGVLGGRWITADEHYGQVPEFRDALDTEGWWYVLEGPLSTPVFTEAAAAAVPVWSGRGRKPTTPRLVAGTRPARPITAVLVGVAGDDWQPLTVADGAQGPRTYQFIARRVWESRDGLPGREGWLVLRRNLDGSEPQAYLSNAPATIPLVRLAEVGAHRWAIATAFQQAKGEAGLDEYEVRGWAGWHHHITLVLLAAAFLLTIQQAWGGKAGPPYGAASGAGAPGGVAAPPLDPRRGLGLVGRHPGPQRAGQTVPSPPPPFTHP
jgi:SRSO17 transposase